MRNGEWGRSELTRLWMQHYFLQTILPHDYITDFPFIFSYSMITTLKAEISWVTCSGSHSWLFWFQTNGLPTVLRRQQAVLISKKLAWQFSCANSGTTTQGNRKHRSVSHHLWWKVVEKNTIGINSSLLHHEAIAGLWKFLKAGKLI